MFYDPMIAKLITWAPTREAAIDAQIAALDGFEIAGVGNNIDFLSAIMQHPRFREGALTTGFIAEEYPEGFHGAPADEALLRKLAAVAVVADLEQSHRQRSIDGQLGPQPVPSTERVVTIDDRRFEVSVDGHDGGLLVNIDGDAPLDIAMDWRPADRVVTARIDGAPLTVRIARTITGWHLTTRGRTHKVTVLPPHVAALTRHMIAKVPPDLSRFLLCPMPGLLTRVEVTEGQRVEAGQPLAVVEAMKMENILRAERPGTVARIAHAAGDSLAVDAVIMEFE